MGQIISASVANLTAAGGEFYIDAEADDSNITFRAPIISVGFEWISFQEVQHESGQTIARYVFQATANTTGENRTGRVDLIYRNSAAPGDNLYPVTISQPVARQVSHYGLSLNMTPESFPAVGGSGTFTSTGTTYYTDGTSEEENALTSLQSSAEWLTIDNNNRTFAVAANTGAARSAVITQAWNGVTAEVTISQAAGEASYTVPVITLSYSEAPATGDTITPTGRITQVKTNADGSKEYLNVALSDLENTTYTLTGTGATIDSTTGVITWSANPATTARTVMVNVSGTLNGKQGTATTSAMQAAEPIADYYDAPTFNIVYSDMTADGGAGARPTIVATQIHHKSDGTTETLTGVSVQSPIFATSSPAVENIGQTTGIITWSQNNSYDTRTAAIQFTGMCNGVQGSATAEATQAGRERIYMWPLWFDHIIEVSGMTPGDPVGYNLVYVDTQHHYDVAPSFEGRTVAGSDGKARINVSEIIRHVLPSGPAWMQEWLYTDDRGGSEKFYVCSDWSYMPNDPFVGALIYDLPSFFMTEQLSRVIYRNARFYIGAWGDVTVTQYDKAGDVLSMEKYANEFLNYVAVDAAAWRLQVRCGGETQTYMCVDPCADRPAYVLNFGNRYGAAQSLCVWGNIIKADDTITRQSYEDGTKLWSTAGAIPRRDRITSVAYTPRWTLNTGFLFNVPAQLMDIFSTPEAELYDVATGTIIPVVIEASTAEYKTVHNQGDRPVNFVITAKQAAQQITYR